MEAPCPTCRRAPLHVVTTEDHTQWTQLLHCVVCIIPGRSTQNGSLATMLFLVPILIASLVNKGHASNQLDPQVSDIMTPLASLALDDVSK